MGGNILIYSNERYWNILLTFPWETTCGSGWVWVMGVWGSWILPSAGFVPGKLLCMCCFLAPGGDDVGHVGEVRHWKDSKFLTWNLTRRLKQAQESHLSYPESLSFPFQKGNSFLCNVVYYQPGTQDNRELATAHRHEPPSVGFTRAL